MVGAMRVCGSRFTVLIVLTCPQHSSTLITIFSNHLLIDTVLSLVPRLGLMYFFSDLVHSSCPEPFTSSHNEGFIATHKAMVTRYDFEEVTSPFVENVVRQHQCETSLLAGSGLFMGIVLVLAIGQWHLGSSIRRYAQHLESVGEAMDMVVDLEKAAFYQDEKKLLPIDTH